MNEGQYDSKNVEHISIENIEVVSNEMDWKSRHLEAEKRKAEIRDRIHKQTEQGQKSAKDYFRPAKPTPSIYDSDLKRVAVYARVSTSSEEQISSIENQTLYYTKKIAETENWNLQDIYSDEGNRVLHCGNEILHFAEEMRSKGNFYIQTVDQKPRTRIETME